MAYVQTGGTYLFGEMATPTDAFSSELIRVQINVTRNTVNVPATYGNNVEEEHPGALKREMQIEFLGTPGDSESFYNLLEDSMTDDGQVAFDVVCYSGAVSTENPRHRGFITISELMHGVGVNEVLQQSVTYPITDYSKSYS